MVMAGFAFHETTIELSHIGIFETFAQPLEAFAAAGLDERTEKKAVEITLVAAAALAFEIHQPVDIRVLPRRAQPETPFLQLGQHLAEMSPFFGHDGSDGIDQSLPGGIALDQRDAAGCCLLFA